MAALDSLRDAPKVELHVHLDGAFDTATLLDAVRRFGPELPEGVVTPWNGETQQVRGPLSACSNAEELEKLVTMGPEPLGLFPMLDCFYRYLPLVRSRLELIEELALKFCERQAQQKVIYTEVRYSPHELLQQDEAGNTVGDITAKQAVEAVCRGLSKGQEAHGILVRQILCCINLRPGWSEETAALAAEFRSQGVVGLDVASGEQHFEDDGLLAAHKAAAEAARAANLGITVHASEVGPPENVRKAIEVYGATRIGHGYRCLGSDVYTFAKERGVHFEVCPTSSIATKGVESLQAHPLKTFCGDRTSCSVSTDDPAVFRTSLTEELEKCVKTVGISMADVEWMTLESLKAAFLLTLEERSGLEQRVRDFYGSK